jgi:hypothetical protein
MSWLQNIFGGKPSQEQFARIVEKTLKEKGVEGKLVYDPQKFAVDVIKADGSFSHSYLLANAYDDYCRSSGAGKREVLDAYLLAAVDIPETLNDAITSIMPRIQMRAFFEQMVLQSQIGGLPMNEEDQRMPHQIVAEHFALSLIFDLPTHVSYISNSKLAGWSTTLDELLPRALTNLARITPEPFQRAANGLYYSHYDDTHDATRLMLKDRITECRLKGRPLAVMPNRNRLFIAGEDDHDAQAKMLDMTDQALEQESRPMAIFPIVFDGTTWKLWRVPETNPHKNRYDRLHALAMNDEYGSQKELLDALHEKIGTDVFVASFVAYQDQEGRLHTMSTITEDVPTLLPKSDEITFVRMTPAPGVVCAAPWDAVAQILGERLVPAGMYPERYFVDYFPSAEEFSQISSASSSSVSITASS